MLQKAVSEMPQAEASYHIKRCVDSGLWVPGGGGDDAAEVGDKGEEETDKKTTKVVQESEEVYENIA